MRKLASVRKIESIRPIEGADAIECATVDNWNVVVKRGEYNVGDLAIYFEIDSWIPEKLAPWLTRGDKARVYEGIEGNRLRTMKLRGQLSQGLLMKVEDVFPTSTGFISEGVDVTEVLGIVKYEAPSPAELSGISEGSFPSVVPKTDQERVQNLKYIPDSEWEVTEKLEGSSMTVLIHEGKFKVCSRNLSLRESESNSFWKEARANDLERILSENSNLAIQGELIGEGIQGNIYGIKGQEFWVYDIFNIDTGDYLRASERTAFCDRYNLRHVPVLTTINSPLTHEQTLIMAEGKSQLNPKTEREGIVFKSIVSGMKVQSFKAISNKYLLKQK